MEDFYNLLLFIHFSINNITVITLKQFSLKLYWRMYRTEETFQRLCSRYYNNYSWYHFLSLYLFINKCAELENCCASLAIRSVLSSSWLSLSPRSNISWCALLTSDDAEVARRSKSCKFAFGPGMCLATDLFAFPLDSPTRNVLYN